jgi:DNA-dependent RNA polymerase auxiliary subunit epsilon
MLISDSLTFTYISESAEEEIEDLFENVQLAIEFVEKFSNRHILSQPSRERRNNIGKV